MSGKPESFFDKRIVGRNLARNRVTRKEYDQYLKDLDDAKEKAVPIFFEEETDRSGEGGSTE